MGYYGKGYTCNDIKRLKLKGLSEYFIEHLKTSSGIEIWTLYNRMFDEYRELSSDLQKAILIDCNINSNIKYHLEVEVLRYCSHMYTSQEFNNVLSLIEESCYKKCNQIIARGIQNNTELYFTEIVHNGLGFNSKFHAVGQLNIKIPVKTVYRDIRKREQLRLEQVNIREY